MRNDASSMQEILADPQDPTRSKFCVEFLNDTYLKNTEKLQAFVTFSKDGIDKGIRCMVSFMRSDDIQAQLDAIWLKKLGPLKERVYSQQSSIAIFGWSEFKFVES
jgi:hypothetical protein